MRKQIQYADEPIGDIKVVADFLPSPRELKFKGENTKVTISLSSESIAYFKAEAKANHTQYQKMIRQLLDVYVARHKTQTTPSGIGEPCQAEIATPRSISCIYKGKEISIDDALEIRKKTNGHLSNETFKCVSCKRPVRPHMSGGRAAAHFEHRKGNDCCPLSYRHRP
ncbi:hypothetical protein [Candidatus Spongiihabitans sp.]|uniref:hypothetical protein n=1 Tax=Candidatus Spongiihabitans sp. TaxID=3101308 RepID=UPI003C7A6A27